jgi:ATP adenylyltransferase
VLPYREVADLELLTVDEERELWANVRDAVTAIKLAYSPQGLNVGINLGAPAGGSVSQHLHVHVLPRWTGDTNFTVVTANTKVLSEPLEATARRIREAWPSN